MSCVCDTPAMQYHADGVCRAPECTGGQVWRNDHMKGCTCPATMNKWNGTNCNYEVCPDTASTHTHHIWVEFR